MVHSTTNRTMCVEPHLQWALLFFDQISWRGASHTQKHMCMLALSPGFLYYPWGSRIPGTYLSTTLEVLGLGGLPISSHFLNRMDRDGIICCLDFYLFVAYAVSCRPLVCFGWSLFVLLPRCDQRGCQGEFKYHKRILSRPLKVLNGYVSAVYCVCHLPDNGKVIVKCMIQSVLNGTFRQNCITLRDTCAHRKK